MDGLRCLRAHAVRALLTRFVYSACRFFFINKGNVFELCASAIILAIPFQRRSLL